MMMKSITIKIPHKDGENTIFSSPVKKYKERTTFHSDVTLQAQQKRDEGTTTHDNNNSSHSLPSSWKKPSKKRLLPGRHTTWKPHYFSSKTNLTWRQRRKIRSISKVIQRRVEARVQEAPFLSASESEHASNPSSLIPIPGIRRKDVTVGVLLGHGAFSEVYEVASCPPLLFTPTTAVDIKKIPTKRLVWKHLKHSTVLISSKSHDNFCQAAVDLCMEAQYLSRLKHDNIITLHGIVQPLNGIPFSDGRYDGYGLLLDYLTDTLDQRLMDWKRLVQEEEEESGHDNTKGGVDFTRAQLSLLTQYALQIADALQYMHSHRIVMLDVKPSNVGFVKQHTVKLFDFGLCRELPGDEGGSEKCDAAVCNTQSSEDAHHKLYSLPVAGTPTYLPGEALCRQKYNCLVDVYAWSMVSYELWTLKKPYESLSPDEHVERVGKQGERPPLHLVPKCFQKLLQNAWEHKVEERWTMEKVVLELKSIMQKEFLNVDTTYADPMHHRRATSLGSISLGKLSLADRLDSLSEGDQGSVRATGITADDFEQFFVSTREDQQAPSGSGRTKSKSWTKLSWSNLKSSLVPAQE